MLQINNICCSMVNVNNSKINRIKSFSKKMVRLNMIQNQTTKNSKEFEQKATSLRL